MLVAEASGDAVAFLNNDTRPRPEWLAAYKADQLHPVSRLNEGFVRPRYPAQVSFSYFQAIQDTDSVIMIHIGSSSRLPVTSDDAPNAVTNTLPAVNSAIRQLSVANLDKCPLGSRERQSRPFPDDQIP